METQDETASIWMTVLSKKQVLKKGPLELPINDLMKHHSQVSSRARKGVKKQCKSEWKWNNLSDI